MMTRNSFTQGARFLWRGQVYVVLETLLQDQLLLKNQSFGGPPIPKSLDELVMAWAAHELIFEVKGRNAWQDITAPIATSYRYADFQQLEGNYEEAWRRYQLIRALVELPRSERTKEYLERYAATKRAELYGTVNDAVDSAGKLCKRRRPPQSEAISRASLERWIKDFIESNSDIRSLVPLTRRQGRGDARLTPEVERIVEQVFAQCNAKPRRRTTEMVHAMVIHEIAQINKRLQPHEQIAPPSLSSIYRRILRRSELHILDRKPSERESQDDQVSGSGRRATRIMQIVEIDFTELDLLVVDEIDRVVLGRPTICIAICRYSGCPVGVYVGWEGKTYRAAMNCVLHMLLPKPDPCALFQTKHQWPKHAYGIPEMVVVDNECSFVGKDMYDAAAQQGFILERSPVKKPWWKASIERFMRTHQEGFVHTLPGSTLSNVLEKGDADIASEASISLSAFVQLLHMYLLDIYMQKRRKGMRGIPGMVWEANVKAGFWPSFNFSAEDTKIMLFQRFERTVGKDGIAFENLEYRNANLSPIRKIMRRKPKGQRDVPIKINPGDLSGIYVLDVTRRKDEEKTWIYVPANDPSGYTQGLSLWKHRAVLRFLRQARPNMFELADALHRMQQIVAREFSLSRKQRTRRSAMRFLGVGTESFANAVPPASQDALPAHTNIQAAPSHPPLLSPPLAKSTRPKTQDKDVNQSSGMQQDDSLVDEPPISERPQRKHGRRGDFGLPLPE